MSKYDWFMSLQYMIKTPVCNHSKKQIFKICINENCKTMPFICQFCKAGCLDPHTHKGGPLLSFIWADVMPLLNKALEDNGMLHPDIDLLEKRIVAIAKKIERVLNAAVSNLKNIKQTAVVKPAFRKTFQKLKTNNFESLTGAELGRLVSATQTFSLLDNQQEINDNLKRKINQINSLIDEFEQKLESQKFDEIQKAKQMLKKAQELRAQKKWKQAIDAYNEAAILDKNSDQIYFCKAFAYDQMKDYQNAIDSYNKAIFLNSTNPSYFNNRGIAYKNLNQPKTAIQDYSKAIGLNQTHGDYFFNRAIAYKMLGQYEQAVTDLTKAIDLEPINPDFYNGRGFTLKALKKYEQAVKDYNKAIQIQSNVDDYYANRGIALALMKEYEKALSDLTRAIQLNPNDISHYKNRYIIYEKCNKMQQAQQDKQKIKQLEGKKQ